MESLVKLHPSRVNVALGLLCNQSGEYCLTQRRQDVHEPGKWEFPGGKCELGETPEEALSREFLEELGIEITASQFLKTLYYDYPSVSVALHVFVVDDFRGTPFGAEGQKIRWVLGEALPEVEMPAGNFQILAYLLSL
jgi:8-oxo-dGTP diphosphatase